MASTKEEEEEDEEKRKIYTKHTSEDNFWKPQSLRPSLGVFLLHKRLLHSTWELMERCYFRN
jgi:hypothetical protein